VKIILLLFIAEWGDLTPPTDPKVSRVGYRVVQVNPATKEVTPFISNKGILPGSDQNALGRAMDYGQVKIDPSCKAENREPYAYVPGTGIIWKVTRK
jgi:hypothetical protein